MGSMALDPLIAVPSELIISEISHHLSKIHTQLLCPEIRWEGYNRHKKGVWTKIGLSDELFCPFPLSHLLKYVHVSQTSESKQSAHLLYCQGRILLYFSMLNKY